MNYVFTVSDEFLNALRLGLKMETYHRWSGWPGAFCLDCFAPDLAEEGLADNCDDCIVSLELPVVICPKHTNGPCPVNKND